MKEGRRGQYRKHDNDDDNVKQEEITGVNKKPKKIKTVGHEF